MQNFLEKLSVLSKQIEERKSYVSNEETTKQSLIIPFIQLLGYDVFDPLEVRPEYVSDFAKKKGEKVDYAIFAGNEPIIFLEAKSINENLHKHSPQIARYYNATHELKLAILTNGIEYDFYTDISVVNVMDEAPFLRFNILNPSPEGIKVLWHLRKDIYNPRTMSELAEELLYANDLEALLHKLLKDPSNEFVRFVVKDVTDARLTVTTIEKFKPIVTRSINNVILSIARELENTLTRDVKMQSHKSQKRTSNKQFAVKSLSDAEPHPVVVPSVEEPPVEELPVQELPVEDPPVADLTALALDPAKPEIVEPVSNEADKEAYGCIYKILSLDGLAVDELAFNSVSGKSTAYLGSLNHWLARIIFSEDSKIIELPYEISAVAKTLGTLLTYSSISDSETQVYLNEINDIYKLARLFIKAAKR